MKEKKADIITVNKVQVQKKVWDRLPNGTKRRIYKFVEVIDKSEVKDKNES